MARQMRYLGPSLSFVSSRGRYRSWWEEWQAWTSRAAEAAS